MSTTKTRSGVQRGVAVVLLLVAARLCRQEQLARASRTLVECGTSRCPERFGGCSHLAPTCRSPRGDSVIVSAAGLEHPVHPVDRLQRDVLSPSSRRHPHSRPVIHQGKRMSAGASHSLASCLLLHIHWAGMREDQSAPAVVAGLRTMTSRDPAPCLTDHAGTT